MHRARPPCAARMVGRAGYRSSRDADGQQTDACIAHICVYAHRQSIVEARIPPARVAHMKARATLRREEHSRSKPVAGVAADIGRRAFSCNFHACLPTAGT